MSWTGVLGCDMVAINCGTLCSRSMWLIGGRPVHALIDGQNEHFNLVQLNTLPFFYLNMFSMQALCLKRALTTGVPGGTMGAFSR